MLSFDFILKMGYQKNEENLMANDDRKWISMTLNKIRLNIFISFLLIIFILVLFLFSLNLSNSVEYNSYNCDYFHNAYHGLQVEGFGKRIFYDLKSKKYALSTHRPVLNGSLGLQINLDYVRSITTRKSDDELLVSFESKVPSIVYSGSHLRIKRNRVHGKSGIKCDHYSWSMNNKEKLNDQSLEDCFNFNSSFWFGGSESGSQQYWPINNQSYDSYRPYLTGFFDGNSAIMERYWLSSSGVAIAVDQAVPLFVKITDNSICFLASSQWPYPTSQTPTLKYDVCTIDKSPSDASYLQNLHLYMIQTYFKRPCDVPDALMFKRPIWSTWAEYKKGKEAFDLLQIIFIIIFNLLKKLMKIMS